MCGCKENCGCNITSLTRGEKGEIGYQGIQGIQGIQGVAGVGIAWKGSLSTAPLSPSINWGYYDTTLDKSFIWDGDSWEIIAQDGATGNIGLTGPVGPVGHNGDDSTVIRTSTTLNTISLTSKLFYFASAPALGWLVGTRLRAYYNGSNYMEGVISTVSSTSVTILVDYIVGSGSYSSWNIAIAGDVGTGMAGAISFQTMTFNGTDTPFFRKVGVGGRLALSFIYPGSLVSAIPRYIKIIAYCSDIVGKGRITITDDTTGLEWISSTLFTPGSTMAVIVNIGVPSNISTTESLISVILEGDTALNTLDVESLFISYL